MNLVELHLVIPTENCEADVAITKVNREEVIYTEEETRGF